MSSAIYHTVLLNLKQAGALLQRHIPERDAIAWLETDRKNDPTIPFIESNGQFFYLENDLHTFLAHFTHNLIIRHNPDRRVNASKRAISSERRNDIERRKQTLGGVPDHFDRRFMLRQERRSDINRRLLGDMDRRCIIERRGRES